VAYDLVVVGGGSAGIWAAPMAARLGARVALVEKERLGGDCTHFGCVPSKALLKAARVAWQMRTAERFGIEPVQPAVDLGRVMASVRQVIEQVYLLEEPEALGRAGVEVVLGAARFADPHTLLVGEDRRIQARKILLCTGARAAVPNIEGLGHTPYWTYATVWQQTSLPRRLLVLGSGPVGLELSQAFGRFGSDVTVFEPGDRPLRMADPEASAVLREVLQSEGVRFRFGARAQQVRREASSVVVTDRGEEVEGDALLVAVGRRPTVDGLALERAGVAYSEKGIHVDRWLRTSQRHIFACGDVIGSFQFTHYAAWQASLAVRNSLFPASSRGVRENVPWTIFTDPEVAQCGLDEAQARQRYPGSEKVRVARWPLDHLDRAMTDRAARGFIKVVHRPNGEVLGAQIVAARAGEMIHELALAIERRLRLGDLAATIHVYPTYTIGVQQLAAEARLRQVASSPIVKLVRQFR
jgi:pyruvate/2-oxoglutarate dehydrogenase complex dihydrolipoamide dehydrogenase (E3) component